VGPTGKILVVGASRGLGKALSKKLVQDGNLVIGISRREIPPTDRILHISTDVSDENQLLAAFARMRKEHGHIDAMVNCAAVASMNHFLLSPKSSNLQMADCNLVSSVSLMREASKLMSGSSWPWRKIVNFSSVAVSSNLEGQLMYAATKAGLEKATMVASKELVELKILANCLRLPVFSSSMSRTVGHEKIKQMIARQTIKQKCTTDDIHDVVSFLLSEKSNFVTGEIITLGGK